MKEFKEELRDQLFDYLSKYPEDATFFLDTVSSALKNYKRAIDIQRHKKSSDAFNILSSFILDSKSFKKLSNHYQFTFLIDTVFLMFPNAIITGHSSSEQDLFNYFCTLVKEKVETNTMDYEWMLEAKGKEIVSWMKELIKENIK